MKVSRPGNSALDKGESASAALIVLILLVIIISLAVGNNIALTHLKREMGLIEVRQLQRYGPAAGTNESAMVRPPPQPSVPARR